MCLPLLAAASVIRDCSPVNTRETISAINAGKSCSQCGRSRDPSGPAYWLNALDAGAPARPQAAKAEGELNAGESASAADRGVDQPSLSIRTDRSALVWVER